VGSAELAESASLLKPGVLLAGKYRVQRLIGRGGMAEVYAATHEVLQQTVAIKILLPDVASNAGATARFINEARAAARIRGENVAIVTDVGALDDGSAYMVLEYLEGEDVEDYASRIGPLNPPEAVDFVLQALQALAQAHTLGFVHRDIKPSNLFLSKRHDGSTIVKVLDFGISKAPRLSESSEGHATSTRTVLGSPYYMAPEQARSARSVDPRADQWAIGVTLYRLLTGELPFGGETLTELLLEIVEATPLRPRSYRPELPEGLEAVVLRCLKKDRTERFTNVAELAQALQPYAGSEGPAVERISRTMGIVRSAVPAPAAAPVPVPPAAEATATPGYVDTASSVVVAPGSTIVGKPASSGRGTAPTMPAPPMTGAASLVGTVESAGTHTHASWGESSIDRPPTTRRAPLLLAAGAGGLLLVGGIVFALTSGHPSHETSTAPVATEVATHPAEQATAPEPTSITLAPPKAAAPVPPTPPSPAPTAEPSATAASVVAAPPPARTPSAPGSHVAPARPAAAAKAGPATSAHPNAPPAAATPAPAQDTYDVLNQRN
jgi:serine/threonine-protein kinase